MVALFAALIFTQAELRNKDREMEEMEERHQVRSLCAFAALQFGSVEPPLGGDQSL
jgi:hypothetical protein